jgi:AraC-like DNA-binding protein
MRYVKPDRLGAVPNSTGGIARLACERIRKAGKDLARFVSRAGLTLEVIEDPSHRLGVETQIKLLEAAARELRDDHLGFHLARDFDLRQIGLLYYVMASSESLAEALRHAERYCSLNNEGVRIRVGFGRAVVVTLEYVNVERGSDRHQIEFWFAALIRVCRHLTNRQLTPRQIRTRHHRTTVPLDVRALLGCAIDFEADADEIVFAASDACLPSVGADAYLNRLLLDYANEALGKGKLSRSTLRFRAEQLIVQLLPHGTANVGEVAGRLGMSRRTLARGLAAEEETFSELLDRIRAALAERYLRERELPISQIAWLLGYREASSFTNAFVRWTGSTPRRFRADHAISQWQRA